MIVKAILAKSFIRLLKGIAGGWLLVIVILPYSLMSGSLGAIFSACLFIVLIWLVIWDYKKGTAKLYPLVLDGLILLGVAAASGAVWGALRAILGYRLAYPWWVALSTGLAWFAILETIKIYANRSSR